MIKRVHSSLHRMIPVLVLVAGLVLAIVGFSGNPLLSVEAPANLLIVVGLLFLLFVLKGIRLYLILLDGHIKGKRFLQLYFETVFTNIVFPLKTGELYRVYRFSHEMRDVKKGLLAVMLDRYFDVLGYLLFILLLALFQPGAWSRFEISLGLAMMAVTLGFLSFQPLYLYLNRLLVLRHHSGESLVALKSLEWIHEMVGQFSGMVRNRMYVFGLVSILVWFVEWKIFQFLLAAMGQTGDEPFRTIIVQFFFGATNPVSRMYLALAASLAALCGLLVWLALVAGKERRR